MDFEAKAREVLLELLGTFSDATDRDSLCFIADALRAAALDEGAREAARAELTGLLAEVKGRAMRPPLTFHVGEAASWDAPPQPTPLADIEAIDAAISANILNPGTALTSPPRLVHLLERLLWLLGLSGGERRFVAALADDPGDCDTAQVYVDWLLDQTADGARLRRLVPKDGDVILWTVSGGEDPVRLAEVRRHAQALCDALKDRGLHTLGAVVPQGVEVDSLGVDAMRAAGWVRAGDVAHRLRHLAEQTAGNPRLCPETVRAAVRSVADAFSAPEAPP